MGDHGYDPTAHYDSVTDAWALLLGDDLHYGDFAGGAETLAQATTALTERMVAAAALEAGQRVLDVGCGTGMAACHLAQHRGVRVTGITPSAVGVARARDRAQALGLAHLVAFEERDGMDNGFPTESFDRVWVLESSHLMRDRARLLSECARVLVPGGRMALCDIVLRRPMPFEEVKRLRVPLAVLRAAFGAARMEPLAEYERLAREAALEVTDVVDLTEATAPTFAAWRANAVAHREPVVDELGEQGWAAFVESLDVLEGFWADGTLGYGLLAATKLR